MAVAAKLVEFERFARSVAETADRLREEMSAGMDPALRTAVDGISRAAQETVQTATSPVKIGVVGAFSSGKTLLLGSLVGYADGLPVSQIPTTGNVTALRFRPREALETTALKSFTIEFLDNQGAEDCLAFLLQEAGHRARALSVGEDLRDRLEKIDPRRAESVEQVEKWCREAWQSDDPNLRLLIKELLAFVRSYARCGSGLCGQERVHRGIDPQVARDGLTLAEQPREIQQLGFVDLPPAPASISRKPEQITAETIRAGFPLIRRVEVEVELSKGIWDLSGLTAGSEFILLDFPGLGAANSGVRDLFLCMRELAEVQTILILTNGNKPGGNEGLNVYNLMRQHRKADDIRDCILVGVGCFDLLPLGHEGEAILEELTGGQETGGSEVDDLYQATDESGPRKVSENQVLERLPVLKACVAGAEALTGRKDRIVLLSPLLHLAQLGESNPSLEVATPDFTAHLRQDALPAFKISKKWGALARRLQDSDPQSQLAAWLSDFAADGGVSQLRKLICSHVLTHGLQQLNDAARRKAEVLRQEQNRLHDFVPQMQDPRTLGDRLDQVRKAFGELAQTYQQLEHQYRSDPPQLELEVQGRSVSVTEMVRDEAGFVVHEWPEWRTLLHAARDGYIVEPEQGNDLGDIYGQVPSDGEGADAVTSHFPVTSDDFYPRFEESMRQMGEFVHERLQAAIRYRVANLASRVAAARENLGELVRKPELQQRFQSLRLDSEMKNLLPALRAAVTPEQMVDGLLRRCGLDKPDALALAPEEHYPLPRSSKANNKPARTFAWARVLQSGSEEMRPERNQYHQGKALRLRNEFVSTMCHKFLHLVSEKTKATNGVFLELLADLSKKVLRVAGDDALLACLVQDVAASADEPNKPGVSTLTVLQSMRAPLD